MSRRGDPSFCVRRWKEMYDARSALPHYITPRGQLYLTRVVDRLAGVHRRSRFSFYGAAQPCSECDVQIAPVASYSDEISPNPPVISASTRLFSSHRRARRGAQRQQAGGGGQCEAGTTGEGRRGGERGKLDGVINSGH